MKIVKVTKENYPKYFTWDKNMNDIDLFVVSYPLVKHDDGTYSYEEKHIAKYSDSFWDGLLVQKLLFKVCSDLSIVFEDSYGGEYMNGEKAANYLGDFVMNKNVGLYAVYDVPVKIRNREIHFKTNGVYPKAQTPFVFDMAKKSMVSHKLKGKRVNVPSKESSFVKIDIRKMI